MHKPDKPRKASAKKKAKDVRFSDKAEKVQETPPEIPQPDSAKAAKDEPAVKDARLAARGKDKGCAKTAPVQQPAFKVHYIKGQEFVGGKLVQQALATAAARGHLQREIFGLA